MFSSKEQKPIVRYFAQECLAVMCIGCRFLNQALMLEALYENCLGDNKQKQIYERFCDRLDAKKIPYLLILDDEDVFQNSYKLEMPMP